VNNKIFIRERINIVDYENNNKGLIYTSSDIDIEGGAINVQLESDVSGWHQLTFDMPAFITKNGKQIKNPLMENLFPLMKLQYTRVTRENNKDEELILYFIIQPQDDSRDESGIVLHNFTCIDYPRHTLSKSKNGITIGEDTIDEKRSMTPNNEVPNTSDGRVIYVKAPVQEFMNVTSYNSLPNLAEAKPGAFAYIPSTGKAYRLTGVDPTLENVENESGKFANWYELKKIQTESGKPAVFETCSLKEDGTWIPEPVWNPDWGGYPLAPDPNKYDYGTIKGNIEGFKATVVQFYWDTAWLEPDKTMGRYDGMLFREGSRLLFDIYSSVSTEYPENFLGRVYYKDNLDKLVPSYLGGGSAYVISEDQAYVYNITTEKWEPTGKDRKTAYPSREILKGKWNKLDPIKAKLAPNYAEKYLDYILDGTDWKVGTVDKIMVDNGTVEVKEDGVIGGKVELSTYLYFDNSNAYNAIAELCDAFKCYPRFDHVNKTVSLKAVPGEDYGLKYLWRDNLKSSRVTQDGEKAVSKLWVYGGEDLNGQVTIADCNRMNPDYYLANYSSLEDLQTRVPNPEDEKYAQITLYKTVQKEGKNIQVYKYSWNDLTANHTTGAEWLTVATIKDLPKTGNLGDTYYVNDQYSFYSWIPDFNEWYDTYLDTEPSDPSEPLEKISARYDRENGKWIYKGQFYHWWEPLSPYADNYILDFSYFLDRKLMTQEQVDDIKYNYILPISHLNQKRWPLISQYSNLSQELLDWNNTYDSCKIAKEAIDKSLRTSYVIYEIDDNNKRKIKDLDINAYPPGANVKPNGWTGWTKMDIAYANNDDIAVETYADLKKLKDVKFGDIRRVKDEQAVYMLMDTVAFNTTICYRLGYNESDVPNTEAAFNKRKKELLTSPDGKLVAENRGNGLFEKFREEELVNRASRASLAQWYNPPANPAELPIGNVGDPTVTSLANQYYDSLDRYATEVMNMRDALDRINATEMAMSAVLKKIEALQNSIDALENALRIKYGDYIVEGVFTDETMVWIYNLWYAGLKALNLYHRPLITYELGVVDVSGLPEYRTVTKDVYHDIVYRLNQSELVLPSPGDYCYVTDNTLGIVAERANITSVVRNLSNPSQNEITIKTVDTNTEDLIGKLVTAANTIYSKEQIYNRSAVVTKDGTIAQDNMSESLDDNSGKMTIMSNNGTVILGENGITTVDRNDPQARMQYTGKGIFASTNGGITWENIINAGKISIKALSAGSIDSNNISVTNIGHDASIVIDGKGITAMKFENGQSIKTFELKASSGNAYFKGTVYASSGEFNGKITAQEGEIGGWLIKPGKLVSSNGLTGMASSTWTGDPVFWAGANDPYGRPGWTEDMPFYVTNQGYLKASNVKITGGTLEIGDNFSVNNAGALVARGAVIEGNITASSGTFSGTVSAANGDIGGWTINKDYLGVYGAAENTLFISQSGYSAYVNAAGTSKNCVFYSHGNFAVDTSGNLYATNVTIQGVGKLSKGSTISNSAITGGSINIGDNTHYLTMKVNAGGGYTNHPSVSGLNVNGTGGINMGSTDITTIRTLSGASGEIFNIKALGGGSIRFEAATLSGIEFYSRTGAYMDGKQIYDTIHGSSSKNMKENLQPLSKEQKENLYKLVQDLTFYNYNYKKEYGDPAKTYCGFLIEDLENSIMDKYLHFKKSTYDKNIKTYDNAELPKVNLLLIKTIQNKIDDLQSQINELKKES
jgi:hypothetical protein